MLKRQRPASCIFLLEPILFSGSREFIQQVEFTVLCECGWPERTFSVVSSLFSLRPRVNEVSFIPLLTRTRHVILHKNKAHTAIERMWEKVQWFHVPLQGQTRWQTLTTDRTYQTLPFQSETRVPQAPLLQEIHWDQSYILCVVLGSENFQFLQERPSRGRNVVEMYRWG